jgi:hypothetical protein
MSSRFVERKVCPYSDQERFDAAISNYQAVENKKVVDVRSEKFQAVYKRAK